MITRRALPICSMLLLLIPNASNAQTSSGAGSLSLTNIVATFFKTPIHQVTMNGVVNWTAGSLEDSGPVTLQASSDGSWTVTMSLQSATRIESQTAAGPEMTCQFQARSDEQPHMGRSDNCRRSATWFLPTITFQPTMRPSPLGIQLVGTVAKPQLRSQLSFTSISAEFAKRTVGGTASTVALDPTTFLPTSLSYDVYPDDGPAIPIPVEVEFGDYRLVDGAEIPYSIKRYLNGTLQADITINSASIQ